jgi:sulfatase modifying factor 1
MAGNIWEWVVKGDSFVCVDNYGERYRPVERRPKIIDIGMSRVGFRTVSRERDEA